MLVTLLYSLFFMASFAQASASFFDDPGCLEIPRGFSIFSMEKAELPRGREAFLSASLGVKNYDAADKNLMLLYLFVPKKRDDFERKSDALAVAVKRFESAFFDPQGSFL